MEQNVVRRSLAWSDHATTKQNETGRKPKRAGVGTYGAVLGPFRGDILSPASYLCAHREHSYLLFAVAL